MKIHFSYKREDYTGIVVTVNKIEGYPTQKQLPPAMQYHEKVPYFNQTDTTFSQPFAHRCLFIGRFEVLREEGGYPIAVFLHKMTRIRRATSLLRRAQAVEAELVARLEKKNGVWEL